MMRRILSLAICFVCQVSLSFGQDFDILELAPRTSIYIETDYSGNEELTDCDWHSSASELLAAAATDGARFGRGCQVRIRIRGTINREGAMLFTDLVSRMSDLQYRPASVVLDSRGGDADAAIAIARLIRRNSIFERVPVETRISDDHQAVCFSACVVIFSAGYRRSAEFDIDGNPALPSRLGIHGPGQFDRESGSYDSAATNAEIMRVSRRLKDYFDGIGVPDKLVDDMFAVPFNEIRLLSREDLVSYRLYPD